MYQGTYHAKARHEPDLDIVLRRAYEKGVQTVISLAGTIEESAELAALIQGLDRQREGQGADDGVRVFGTVGVHPTRCAEVFAERGPASEGDEAEAAPAWIPKTAQQQQEIRQQLVRLATGGGDNVVAIGECGLDYARLHFCPKEIQQLGWRAQLEVACETKLVFLGGKGRVDVPDHSC